MNTTANLKEAINILIVDDTPEQIQYLAEKLGKIGFKSVRSASTLKETLKVVNDRDVDVLLMDYDFKGREYTGVDIVSQLKDFTKFAVIFISTHYHEHVYDEVKKVGAKAFLNKNASELELLQAIELAYLEVNHKKEQAPQDFFLCKIRKTIKKIYFSEINYVEVSGRYSQIYFDGGTAIVDQAIKNVAPLLQPFNLVRIHKSFIVNNAKITSINIDDSTLTIGDKIFPIGRSFRKNVLSNLKLGF